MIFLNVDGEFLTEREPKHIRETWRDEVDYIDSVRAAEGWLNLFEVDCALLDNRQPSAIVERIAYLVNRLPKPARQEWDGAIRRVLDFGYEVEDVETTAGDSEFTTVEVPLSHQIVLSAANLGCEIRLTLYRNNIQQK
jgi:hypothetical protein